MTYRYAHRAVLLLLVLTVLTVVPVAAQDAGHRLWTPLGPPGGAPVDFLLRADGHGLGVSPGGSLFVADPDLGWSLVGTVRGFDGHADTPRVAAAPSDPRLLYALTSFGLQRSSDGGATWEVASDVLVSPSRLLVLASGSGTVLLRLLDGAVERSTDGGVTWQRVSAGVDGFVRVLEPLGPGGALLATPGAVARSTDAGAGFTALGELPGAGGEDAVAAVAAAPAAPQRVFVVTRQGRTLTSVDGGASWQVAAGTLPADFAGRLTVDPDDPELLYAVAAGRLHVSRDGGGSWRANDLPREVRAVLPLRGDGDAVLASTTGVVAADLPAGGVYRSDDGGRTWHGASEGLQAHTPTSFALRPGEPSTLLATVSGALLRRRPDEEWRRVEVPPVLEGATGEPVGPVRVGSVHVAPRAPDRWVVPVTIPVDGGQFGSFLNGGLQLTGDGGRTWQPLDVPALPLSLVAAPSLPERAYFNAGTTTDRDPAPFCTLFRLTGSHLDCLFSSLDLQDGEAMTWSFPLAVDAADADRIYSAFGQRLGRSTDGGDSWTDLLLPFRVFTTATHPVVAGLVAAGGFDGEVWISEDGGGTWAPRGVIGDGWMVRRLVFDPLEPRRLYALSGDDLWRSGDGGRTWVAGLGAASPLRARVTDLVVDPADPSVIYAVTDGAGLWRLHRRFPASPCVGDARTLCLGAGDRFRVRVAWQDFGHAAGYGRAVPRTAAPGDAETGAFWFFDPDNLELLVKVIDGADVNRRHWVFYGALTNVPFTLVGTDTATGERVGYFNPARRFASRGDTTAFPEGEPDSPAPPPGDAAPPLRDTVEPSPCVPSESTLCLGAGDRFRAEVAWEDFQGGSGTGTAVPETGDTGFFWFFKESNLELAVKVLDGRPVNGNFWVFYGALTNVAFRLTVTDTATGQVRTYVNPSRNFASRGDVDAFGAAP